MQIRPRKTSDLDRLETMARAVRSSDDYPHYMTDDDFAALLTSRDAISSWVAVDGVDIVGQISLHSRSSNEIMGFVCEHLGVTADRFGVISRLIVDPSSRRSGTGRALLDAAEQDALDRGLVPILDVVDKFTPAIALYEQRGWKRLGTVSIQLPDQTTLNEHVYRAPTR